MKTKNTVFCSFALTLLFLQTTAWSQVQWASPDYPQGYLQRGALGYSAVSQAGQQSGGYPQGLVQASHCADCGAPDASCGCGALSDSCTGACGGACGGGCGHSGIFGRLLGLGGAGGAGGSGLGNGCWLDADYLYWWSKERYIPALVTTSPVGTPDNVAGILGQPTTSVLFGDTLVGGDPESGFRVSGGKWLDSRETVGIGGRYFMAGGEEDFSRTSNGDPILARPFFDTVTVAPNALLVAFPGISHGTVNVTAENRVRGFDVYLRKLLLAGYCNRWDIIGGYHNSNVEDTVDIQNSLVADDSSRIPIGSQVATQDFFEVDNQFHGGFVGLMASAADGRLSWNLLAKVAVGNMNQEATISGSTTSIVPGNGTATDAFGLLTQPGNIGSFDRDEFAIVPELNVTVGYNVTNNLSLTLGYTFIYWSEVALAGDMIDPTVAPSQPSLQSDGFWYTGLNSGISLRF